MLAAMNTTSITFKTRADKKGPAPKGNSKNPIPAFAYQEQLQMLKEIFPNWHSDDLKAVLLDLCGDVDLAISRISDGHVKQFASAGPKTTATTNTSTFSNSRQQPKNKRQDNSLRRKQEPNTNDSTYTRKTRENSVPKVVKPEATTSLTKVTFADAVEAEKLSKANKIIAPVPVVEEVQIVETVAKDVVSAQAEVAEPVIVEREKPIVEVFIAEFEEEFVVKMPVSSKKNASLVVEQPAVIMPIRAPMRSGLSIRFGTSEDTQTAAVVEEVASVKDVASKTPVNVEVSPSVPASTSRLTPISVSALESSIAALTTKEAVTVINDIPMPSSSHVSYSRPIGYAAATVPVAANRNWPAADFEDPMTATTAPAPGFTAPQPPQRYSSASQVSSTYVSNSTNNNTSSYQRNHNSGNNVSQYYTGRSSSNNNTSNTTSTTGSYMNNRMNSTGINTASSPSSRYNAYDMSQATAAHHQPIQAQPYAPYYGNRYAMNASSAPYHHSYGYPPQSASGYFASNVNTASSPTAAAPGSPLQVQQAAAAAAHYASQGAPAMMHHHPHHPQQYQHYQQQSQQPYYQPYQPPHQYLNNNNNQHHNSPSNNGSVGNQ